MACPIHGESIVVIAMLYMYLCMHSAMTGWLVMVYQPFETVFETQGVCQRKGET